MTIKTDHTHRHLLMIWTFEAENAQAKSWAIRSTDYAELKIVSYNTILPNLHHFFHGALIPHLIPKYRKNAC
jgi:hypothetical protein